MLCSQVRKKLYRYISGDTDKSETILIQDHLNSCFQCKLEYERIVDIKHILSNMGRSIEAPSGLITNIMDSIDLQRYKTIGINAVNSIRSLGISMVAAGLIMALLSLYPQAENYMDMNNMERNIAKIQNSIIKPIESINNNIIDISEKIFQLDLTLNTER
ncbi:MAG: hypothetical protein GX201_13405 [Clostridiales bacterium]|nr:hypothetical protein [Clostridiales bacterium]